MKSLIQKKKKENQINVVYLKNVFLKIKILKQQKSQRHQKSYAFFARHKNTFEMNKYMILWYCSTGKLISVTFPSTGQK